jgi:hypothetical protein
MRRVVACALLLTLSGSLMAAEKDNMLYELRIYTCPDNAKLDALHVRFRDHTCKLFEKHGMTNIGYWTPIDNPKHQLIYIIAHKNRDAANASWKAFIDDPDWKKAFAESRKNGALVIKVDHTFMQATDYSPAIKPSNNGEHLFELRTYTASPGALGHLNARFREHTCKLFEKHGMTNVAYFNPVKGEKTAGNTLIYILAHKNREAAKASWDAFRNDPDWMAVKKHSEQNAGGSLTVKDGVKSIFMKPTDYSPIK